MKRKYYAVRDTKMGTFAQLVPFENDAVAIRGFSDLVHRDKDSMIAAHPADFSLFYIGEFDVETGVLTQSDTDIRVLCTASDFVKGE